MINRRFIIASVLSVPVIFRSTKSFAHREKLTSTIIHWKNATQTLEINHIFHIHHTEQALKDLKIIERADLRDLENQARLALYVEENFGLKTPGGQSIDLLIVGAEADGENLHVYQEAKLKTAPESLLVYCSFLRPILGDQINEIHLNMNNEISSMRLSGRQTEKLLIAN